jgi:hypothetical protein
VLESAACCHVILGQREAARQCVLRLEHAPALAGDALGPLRRRNPVWDNDIKRWLREAAGNDSASA